MRHGYISAFSMDLCPPSSTVKGKKTGLPMPDYRHTPSVRLRRTDTPLKEGTCVPFYFYFICTFLSQSIKELVYISSL